MIIQCRDLRQWHRVFAWVPHDVGGDRLAWLRTVERKALFFTPFGALWFFRLPGDTSRDAQGY
jgi:hypothetical protein